MIEILNQQKRFEVNTDRLKRLLEYLIHRYQIPDPEITLALVNNKPIRELHRRFLKKDKPTDVLSFPVHEKGPDGKYYLGDIIISVPYASGQSKAQGHSLQQEVEYLVIHGLLHLQGFEHYEGLEEEEQEVRTMWMKENHAY
jgi:probable rRNA maturation factor